MARGVAQRKNLSQVAQIGDLLTRPTPARQGATRPRQGRSEVRDAKIMNVTLADAGEAVSRPCLGLRHHILICLSCAAETDSFPWEYVEGLYEAEDRWRTFSVSC
jgi:hypothetical protein